MSPRFCTALSESPHTSSRPWTYKHLCQDDSRPLNCLPNTLLELACSVFQMCELYLQLSRSQPDLLYCQSEPVAGMPLCHATRGAHELADNNNARHCHLLCWHGASHHMQHVMLTLARLHEALKLHCNDIASHAGCLGGMGTSLAVCLHKLLLAKMVHKRASTPPQAGRRQHKLTALTASRHSMVKLALDILPHSPFTKR